MPRPVVRPAQQAASPAGGQPAGRAGQAARPGRWQAGQAVPRAGRPSNAPDQSVRVRPDGCERRGAAWSV